MYKHTIFTCWLLLAVVSPGAFAQTVTPAMAERVDSSGVVLCPNVAPRASQARLDLDALAAAVSDDDGIRAAPRDEFSVPTGHRGVRVGTKRISTNEERGLVLVRDDRGYDVPVGPPRINRATMQERAATVLASIGVLPDETEWYSRELESRSMVEGGLPSDPEFMAYKLFVYRKLAGIPVRGDKLVLSFAGDGSLRKILGSWRAIDLDHSQLATKLSREEVAARGIGRLNAAGSQKHLDLRQDTPVVVMTQVVPYELTPGRWAAKLVGTVRVLVAGPEGMYRWSEYDFDLN